MFTEVDIELHKKFNTREYIQNKSLQVLGGEALELVREMKVLRKHIKLSQRESEKVKRKLQHLQQYDNMDYDDEDDGYDEDGQGGDDDYDDYDNDDDDGYGYDEEEYLTEYVQYDDTYDEDYDSDEDDYDGYHNQEDGAVREEDLLQRKLQTLDTQVQKMNYRIHRIEEELDDMNTDTKTFLKPVFAGKNLTSSLTDKITDTPCTSYCLREREYASLQPLVDNEGDLICTSCNTRCGTYKWSGGQCPCGTWITPSIQIPLNRVDRMILHVPTGRPAPPHIYKTYLAEGEKNMPINRGVTR